MSNQSDTVQLDEYRKLQERKVGIGAKIQEFVKSDGFLVLKAILKNFEHDVKNKGDYPSIEDFRADRKALKIVDGLFAELDSMVEDANHAQEAINKLIESESSTPSLLSLDGEGTEAGQQSDS